MNSLQADEQYARALQAMELDAVDHIEANTSTRGQQPAYGAVTTDNTTVINARISEITSSWVTVGIVLLFNLPQIIAGTIILGTNAGNDHTCDEYHRTRWTWWALLSVVRMTIYSIASVYIQYCRRRPQSNQENLMKAVHVRNSMEAFGLIWFVVGNMWLFGDDEHTCDHPEHSRLYQLCLAYLIITYLQICFPCIVAVLLVPVFCFCMPCFIRILARLHDSQRIEGAPQSLLDTLPLETLSEERLNGQSLVCPICLNELVVGESVRYLQCSHIFHQHCVDEWLRVNATCPTCRKSIREQPETEGREASQPEAASTSSEVRNHTMDATFNPLGRQNLNQMPIAPTPIESRRETREDTIGYNRL